MNAEIAQQPVAAAAGKVTKQRRIWVPFVLLAAFWILPFAVKPLDLPIYASFFTTVGSFGVLALAFSIWWLTSGGARLTNRFLILVTLIAIGVVTAILADKSVGPIGLIFFGAPVALTAAVLWLFFSRNRSAALRNGGMITAFAIFCGLMLFVRVDGVDGNQQAAVHGRWSHSAEDLYLAERTAGNGPAKSHASQTALVSKSGDWTDFRGPDRRGEVHGIKVATDWQAHPPKLVWRQRIGPAWSSMLVLGNRLFTQEQRGESEAVVCLDTTNGHELWAHEYKARFFDGQAGAGPRSSPTFSAGRIYTLGATGILSCLEAAGGKSCWSRDIIADSGAPKPMWGFSSSPLVVDGTVIVYAGGKGDKGLLAYRTQTGEPAWSVATGPVSYSSPQVVSIHGQRQVLFLSDSGLVGIDGTSGKVLWEHKAPGTSMWRVALPRQIDQAAVVVGSEDLGLVRLDLTGAGQSWTPSARWDSRALRPAYNDFVSLDGFIYGFDESFFCCVDASTGKRRWKAGRYGHGQVLLLGDQRLLLVISEDGQAVLVSARPDQHEELGRFQAISGKTWNHPAIANGCLYVRNAEEIACFQLPAAK
jgi:outer membrane protein assembly factor BamB